MGVAPRPPKREFLAIGEVCALLDIKAHVLRYWETQFQEFRPVKNRAGNRLYRASDLQLIALIRRLVHEERYTLEGARQKISELRAAGGDREIAAAALERSVIRAVRDELEKVKALLHLPPR
ncbi:MAG: MerR family transcriptional regulator [Gemmatimonadota bacterium]|nr:MerR family transcriptional regulator [Gemmatimonadota bacterium]